MRYHTQEHRHSVSALSWSHDSALLLSGSYDHTVRQWDVSARRFPTSESVAPAPCLRALPPHPASSPGIADSRLAGQGGLLRGHVDDAR